MNGDWKGIYWIGVGGVYTLCKRDKLMDARVGLYIYMGKLNNLNITCRRLSSLVILCCIGTSCSS
jgi:hypothetical protein